MMNKEKTVSEGVLYVHVGEIDSPDSKDFDVKTLIIHDGFNKNTYEHDIALLEMKESLDLSKNFRSICFSQLGSFPQAYAGIAIGYGSTDDKLEHSHDLREVEIPIKSREECHESDTDFFEEHLFEGNFCAGELNVMKGVCGGDSGGGLYVRIKNNYYLQGITSFTKNSEDQANPTCNYASYAIFTNVTFYSGKINR
jgi:secreted trypsin-like serine protease